jgi:hypothetical protein
MSGDQEQAHRQGMLGAEQTDLWSAPRPATDAELEAVKLPCDVAVGSTVFRKGTSLLALVGQHRELYRQIYNKGDLV